MRFVIARVARVALVAVCAAAFCPHLASAQSGGTLKVLDWNTHHGVGTDGTYNLQRFVTWIARSGAHVVSLNEVEKYTGWGNEDQPARYAALLRSATGKTWYYAFAQRDGGTNGQGNLILSTFPIEAADKTTLSYSRSVARAQITVNGTRVNVFSTHLDADSGARRATQMAELKTWAGRFSQQHIIAGDFNAWPGASEITGMTAFARDAWATAKANGTAVAYSGNEAGNTRNSRIDYIWYAKSATRLTLTGAQVFDTRDSSGDMPSDHRPVMATFRVGAGTVVAETPSVSVSASGYFGADFDGDAKSDLSVYRPRTGEWFVFRSGGAGLLRTVWGAPALGDRPAAGDYDGDRRQDIAVFRPGTATWYLLLTRNRAQRTIQWGAWSDLPVPGDYNGDGLTDIAVFRPSNGVWYIRDMSSGAPSTVQWGEAGDVPVPGDYDGDRQADLAVFRPSNGTWYVRSIATGAQAIFQWGGWGDTPVPGDYDGDGRIDAAVFRPSNATWYIRYSNTGATSAMQWGATTDRPVAADYDGDRRTDLAVFRPSAGTWHIVRSSSGRPSGVNWGGVEDVPIPSR
jgi:endonuclease/exonuclease/phosphatase family metal-dependent hydrolase